MLKTVVLAAAVLAGSAATGSAQQLIRVASFTAEHAIGVQKVMIPWMEAIEAEVGDQVDLKGFWGGSLGRDPFKQYDLVKSGVVDVAWIVGGYAPGRFPQLEVLQLPFMAQNAVDAGLAGWDLYEKGLVGGLDDFKVITIWAASGDLLHTRTLIDSLDDVEGLRLRTASSAQAETLSSVGAVPQTMGPVEVNDALSRGALDGLVQGYTGMKTFGTFNVVAGSYEVPLGSAPFLLLMNKAKWEALPAPVKAAFDKHGGAVLSKAAGEAYDAETQNIRAAQAEKADYKIVTPSASDLDGYREEFQKVHKAWIDSTERGQEVYDTYSAFLDARPASN